ncbi:MAG TPA: long-chain-fatty-acid--CoA ligase [Candidatus Binatia bacterium]|jgi:acyl-CoA synthetase (AMP-forming)/AMP-acid ligase II|nr:long-chain-fatty-acid--CoA ligase [Candidatus Binatia bacterium]
MALLLGEILRRHARHRGERTAYVLGGARVSYRRFDAMTNRLAHALRALGVRHGDRIATLARNRVEYPWLYFAAAKLGAIHVPLNFRHRAAEVRWALAQSEASVVFHAAEFADVAAGLRPDLPALRHAVSLDGDRPGSLADLLARASDAEPPGEPRLDERDPHVMLYTSGTTGEPKGALLSHRAYVLQAAQTQATIGLGEDDVGLCMFPMFHMGGWAMPLGYWASGGTVVLMERADPEEILRTVARERVTYLYLIPTLWDAVLGLPTLARTDRSSLRTLGAGTSAMTAAQIRAIVDGFGNPNLFVVYGQSEAGPIATLRPADVLRKPTSVGRPVPTVEVRVVDAADRDVAVGETGEVVCRSEFVMLGYWRMPEETARTLAGGWCRTGDLATFDDEGFLHIAGRVTDMIKCGGENIYPVEVERCLLEHPAIAEAAVFGVPDAHWGEIAVAAVVRRTGAALDEAQVIEHVRARLAGYKKPRAVRFVDALPRTASTRQVQKAILREQWTCKTV